MFGTRSFTTERGYSRATSAQLGCKKIHSCDRKHDNFAMRRSHFEVLGMLHLENSSQEIAFSETPIWQCIHTWAGKLLMGSVFFVVVAAIIPTATSAEVVGSHVSGQSGKKHSGHRNDGSNHHVYYETPSYNGNWGFTPGNGLTSTDWGWRRSRGFWDTTAPACPFRTC